MCFCWRNNRACYVFCFKIRAENFVILGSCGSGRHLGGLEVPNVIAILLVLLAPLRLQWEYY